MCLQVVCLKHSDWSKIRWTLHLKQISLDAEWDRLVHYTRLVMWVNKLLEWRIRGVPRVNELHLYITCTLVLICGEYGWCNCNSLPKLIWTGFGKRTIRVTVPFITPSIIPNLFFQDPIPAKLSCFSGIKYILLIDIQKWTKTSINCW